MDNPRDHGSSAESLAFCDAKRLNVLLGAVEDLFSWHRATSLIGKDGETCAQTTLSILTVARSTASVDSRESQNSGNSNHRLASGSRDGFDGRKRPIVSCSVLVVCRIARSLKEIIMAADASNPRCSESFGLDLGLTLKRSKPTKKSFTMSEVELATGSTLAY